jgi:hypothetical protein
MFLPNPGTSEIACEEAHFECQKETLLSRHRVENLKLDGLRLGACIARKHEEMLSRRRCSARFGPGTAAFGCAETFIAQWIADRGSWSACD